MTHIAKVPIHREKDTSVTGSALRRLADPLVVGRHDADAQSHSGPVDGSAVHADKGERSMKHRWISKQGAVAAVAMAVGSALLLSATSAGASIPEKGNTAKRFHAPISVPAGDVVSVKGPANGPRTVVLTAAERSVKAGSVLVVAPGARTPHGLLVKVVSVRAAGSGVSASTVPAGISDALPPGTYKKTIAVPTPPSAKSAQVARPNLSTGSIPWSVGISKGVQCNGTVTAQINGSLQIAPSADVDIDVDVTGIHSASLSMSMTEDAALQASVAAAASCTAKNVPIVPTVYLPGFYIGPVYIEPTFTVTLDALLNTTGSASVSGAQHFRGNVAVSYDPASGLHGSRSASNTFDFAKPQLAGSATLEGGVTASMALLIEGLAGPRVDARGYIGITADSNAIPWWRLYGGISIAGGIQALAFNLGSVTIWSQQWTLLQALGLVGGVLPTAVPATPYSNILHALGGVGADTYAVTSGALPAGLTMSRGGVISGTPQIPSSSLTSSFVVTATDSTGNTAAATYSITVPALSIGGLAVLPSAAVGAEYVYRMLSAGVVGAPSWRLSAGTLPAGLTLDSTGMISGTPTTAGSRTFSVTLSDSTGRTVSRSFSLAVTKVALPVCGMRGCTI